MRELEDLSGLSMFVRIVEEGSLSAAGRALGVPKATISRHLALLEKRLGAPLLIRSTRALSLTDTGRRFFDRVQPIVRDAQRATAEVKSHNAAPSGLLRISASVAYGQAAIAPRLLTFMRRYPAVRIDLHLHDGRVNLVSDGYDLAIRMGVLEDSELVSHKLADIHMVIVASPSWLEQHDMPRRPGDLAGHPAVLTRPDMIHWQVGGETVRVPWRMSTGNMILTRDAARAGLGIALVPEFLASRDLERGTLVRLLPDLELPVIQATALYPRAAGCSAALRALLDDLLSSRPIEVDAAPW
ncbi:transcriptional regulator [Sorangium cellulosum]|uniref:Transcriptional regulator n=1 Tax=Sorangium cellulosum TaxID=56 RepID=A0A4P2PUM2_SORCE|nr:LysR family transcriptional regulator [Sorangium cellulosum]AUX20359.1 transcriptional regulator [Sorangium cellulosum]